MKTYRIEYMLNGEMFIEARSPEEATKFFEEQDITHLTIEDPFGAYCDIFDMIHDTPKEVEEKLKN